uniref:Putative secreted protein n=1 Tax=Anopheles triannulatus TaxID=58253 RepID=A0A2M4B4E9_9DIPT
MCECTHQILRSLFMFRFPMLCTAGRAYVTGFTNGRLFKKYSCVRVLQRERKRQMFRRSPRSTALPTLRRLVTLLLLFVSDFCELFSRSSHFPDQIFDTILFSSKGVSSRRSIAYHHDDPNSFGCLIKQLAGNAFHLVCLGGHVGRQKKWVFLCSSGGVWRRWLTIDAIRITLSCITFPLERKIDRRPPVLWPKFSTPTTVRHDDDHVPTREPPGVFPSVWPCFPNGVNLSSLFSPACDMYYSFPAAEPSWCRQRVAR